VLLLVWTVCASFFQYSTWFAVVVVVANEGRKRHLDQAS
jgi:hypothetical protein